MDYELAKQLKDVGFPQLEKEKRKGYCSYLKEENSDDFIVVPTLSELIEACEGALESLENKIDRKSMERIWKAWGIEMESWNDNSNQMGQGLTPEEAVAKLWLKLNKNK